ncbi:MAG: hypothetical protein COV59_01645 [Candidatus Magasanikbacteria bacterium CG11_big_fil_rev_8_21_14_0_20_39_34]|uniref:Uncharacterized protein n=1 Tax=Candidatus Magasanikbacteria bacterium CG11_big_fil_rev_8_21_14_0_20_39_34 TaxID=1974653 RepID=A0A2H0N5Z5_9BACT|nr:MAG: hypothetical protein COV59_01645 [Candidatus Magasanikbacteria bacterium CG11_big_fil_rev_8_21_14_0_20_39_34]
MIEASKMVFWLKKLLLLQLILSVGLVIIFLWIAGQNPTHLDPFWLGFRSQFITEDSLSYQQVGEAATISILSLFACMVSLLSIQKGKKFYYYLSLFFWILIVVGALGSGKIPPILPLVILMLMLSKVLRNYQDEKRQ